VPPHAIGVCVVRERVCVPAPHVTEQPDHAVNGDHTQLAGQQTVLQSSLSDSAPQVPPHDSGFWTVRDRERVPPPHVFEHAVHPDHALSSQFIAQHDPPQVLSSDKSVGHALPPHAAITVTARVRVCVPVEPHDAEQVPHCDQPPT
jgi:hypothetical protein